MNKILDIFHDLHLTYDITNISLWFMMFICNIGFLASNQKDLYIVSMVHHDTLDDVHMCDKCYFILCNEKSHIVMIYICYKFSYLKPRLLGNLFHDFYEIKVLMYEYIFSFTNFVYIKHLDLKRGKHQFIKS